MAASWVRFLRGLYVLFLICLLSASAFLNLEELNEMKYGIQILPDPVIRGQMEDVMLVSNKYKQLYECRLPAQAVRFHQDPVPESDPQGYSGPAVPELLKPMHSAPCLIKTKDWWTYEFCYGQHIRQYHLEDSEIKGDVLFLGYFESEFDWTNETAKATKQHKLKRYHSQSYVNGSKCDLNGNPRESEVRFVCEEGSSDYISRVDEPQSCHYVLTVHTSRTCQHPLLRPPSSAKPQAIVCQPALSAQQYMDYVKAQVSDTKRKVEQISEELRTLDQILSKDESREETGSDVMDEESVPPTDTPAVESEVKGQVVDAVDEEGEESVSEEAEDKDFWDGVTKPEGAETQTPELQESDGEPENEPDDNDTASVFVFAVFGEGKFNFKIMTDPVDLMKFVQHLRDSNRKNKKAQVRNGRSQTSSEETEKEKEKEDEEEERKKKKEVEEEEEEGDEDERLLKEFEEEMADLSVPASKIVQIKEEMQKEFDNIIEEAQQELENEGLKGEFDRSQATQTLENTLGKLLDRLEDKTEQDAESHPDTHTHTDTHTHKNTHTHTDTHTPDKRETGGARGDPSLVPKTPGKIEVKILTRKSAEEAGDQWLSEEDTKSFRELLINLLTGGTEEVYKEQKRQQELENNYRFVWGEKQDESQSTGTGESDELDF
ncbi:protein OS-9 isoform X4 [Pangasianodon hypophthalmus]|uniref:protein OS-9 isoform X4 n=1 Tax=Pangasianodon hypophthalmus TaxID=310915 RepID=UPI002306E795|nr:protein OS-9 isoform X4 [Pangasianodon hypophthalmus]